MARNSGHVVPGSSQSHVRKHVQPAPLVQNDMARFGLDCLAPPLPLPPPPPPLGPRPLSHNFFTGFPLSLPAYPMPYLSRHLPFDNDMGDIGMMMPNFAWNRKQMFANNGINGSGNMLMPSKLEPIPAYFNNNMDAGGMRLMPKVGPNMNPIPATHNLLRPNVSSVYGHFKNMPFRPLM